MCPSPHNIKSFGGRAAVSFHIAAPVGARPPRRHPHSTTAPKTLPSPPCSRFCRETSFTISPRKDPKAEMRLKSSAALQFDVPLQQTEIGLKYTYGVYYYQARQ